ncbi:MAG: hypothetical protein LUO89_14235, partial [Methanothrix sp.]|nr:hypothetical protein [Methanothrix sp.]
MSGTITANAALADACCSGSHPDSVVIRRRWAISAARAGASNGRMAARMRRGLRERTASQN